MTPLLEHHILAYVIGGTGRFEVISFYQLQFTWPLSVYSYQGKLVVQNSSSHTGQIF